jgi:DNA-binding NtrC family response regulator
VNERDATLKHRTTGVPLRTLRVEVVKGSDAGRKLGDRERIAIGTAEGNDLVLTDETVSRYHVELAIRGDRIAVRDHGSTNGTAIGSAVIEQGSIGPGTILTLGRTQIRVDHGETATLEIYGAEQLGGVVGRSASMRRLMAQIDRAAVSDVSILLLGETGTGKEVAARAIHAASKRAAGPFETVDCGSLLPTLIASELFGHEKGAFTGAEREHIGAFERAHGGTLFLDEIGELPAALQPALLGAIERRSFRRVGGGKTINVDVRLICATHRDLRSEVNAGRFRQDLYFRIGVVMLEIPPLRERPEDIPLLVEYFLRDAGFEGPRDQVVPPQVLEMLTGHQWPGNVRELRNFVEAALALGETPGIAGRAIERDRESVDEVEPLLDRPYADAKAVLLDHFERRYLAHMMEKTNGNISAAARAAKMNRSYLLELLKRHGLRGDQK